MADEMLTEASGQALPETDLAQAGAFADVDPALVAASAEDAGTAAPAIEYMLDLPLEVTVELGRTTMQLGEALALQPGSIIELNRLPGEPLDMHLNDRLVARGEVVVVNDALALRVTQVVGRGRK